MLKNRGKGNIMKEAREKWQLYRTEENNLHGQSLLIRNYKKQCWKKNVTHLYRISSLYKYISKGECDIFRGKKISESAADLPLWEILKDNLQIEEI